MERILKNGIKIRYTGTIIAMDLSDFSGEDQELNNFVEFVGSFLRNLGVTKDSDSTSSFIRPGQSIMALRKPIYISYTGEEK